MIDDADEMCVLFCKYFFLNGENSNAFANIEFTNSVNSSRKSVKVLRKVK